MYICCLLICGKKYFLKWLVSCRQLYHNPCVAAKCCYSIRLHFGLVPTLALSLTSKPQAPGDKMWPAVTLFSDFIIPLFEINSSPFCPTVWAESSGKSCLYSGIETLHYSFGSHPMRWMRVVHMNWGVNNLNLLLWWKEKDSFQGTHKVLQKTLVFFWSTCKWSCSGR